MPNWSDVHGFFLAASPTLWLEQADHLTSSCSRGHLPSAFIAGVVLWKIGLELLELGRQA